MFFNKLLFNIKVFRNKLNIKEAIDYIAEAWDNVSQKTIQNCWKKTGILPSYDDDDNIDDDNERDFKLNELNEFDFDYLPEDDNLQEYFQIFDQEIPTEEQLTDDQIINLVQDNEDEDESDTDTDEEILPISVKKSIDGLRTFVNYFEQQDDAEFNVDDLLIFQKYLRIIKTKEFNSRIQKTLDMYLEQ